MNLDQYLIFITITSIFLLSPGPSVFLSIHNGIKYGARRSSFAVLGNIAAFQLLILLSSLGLGAALAASGELFNLLKIAGAVYLIYLGLKVWFLPTSASRNSAHQNHKLSNPHFLFRQAFITSASNPKALVYVSALLPQFVNTEEALLPQIFIIAFTSAVVQFVIFMSYVLLSSKAGIWLENPKKRKLFNRLSGISFIGFGLALAMSESKM